MKRMLSVAIVGSGFGGLGMGAAFKAEGVNNFRIFEKADDLGGVWRANTYPGCACDVPSHLYSFSFAPYRDSRIRYPRQVDIQAYLRQVAEDCGLVDHLRFNTAVTGAVYHEDSGCWRLSTDTGEEVLADDVVFALGQLDRPNIPAIAGREQFEGKAFHSARWDHGHDLRGCDVAVVGTGSSAAQMVPMLAATARTVTVYQRTPHWVLPKPGPEFGPVSRLALRIPGAHGVYRKAIYYGADFVLPAIMRRGWSARPATWAANWYRRHTVRDPALRAALEPSYPIGGKRIVLDSNFFPALNRANVELVTASIARMTREGIETVDGVHRPADVVVFATGFKASEFMVPLTVRGRGGRLLNDEWASGAQAFMGVAVPGYPNAWMIAGPNSFTPSGSNPTMKENQIAFIMRCRRWREELGAAAIEVSPEAMASFQRWLQESLADTVWPDSPAGWYRHASGTITSPWSSTSRAFAKMLRAHPTFSFTPVATAHRNRGDGLLGSKAVS